MRLHSEAVVSIAPMHLLRFLQGLLVGILFALGNCLLVLFFLSAWRFRLRRVILFRHAVEDAVHALQGQRVLGQVLHSALRSVVVWLKVLGAALSTIGRHELHYDAPRMRCDDATPRTYCVQARA